MIIILQDGFSNFQNHIWMILCIFLVIIWGQAVMQKILSKIFDNQFTIDEYFALSLSSWVFPAFAWAGIYLLINIFFGRIFANIISIIVFFIPFLFIKIKKISPIVLSLSSFLLISLFLRLAFLQQSIFPAYFDSAEHYKNIQDIISIYENKSSSLFQYNYYHLGYHFLSAALIHFFQFNEINFMLVFGQVILAILPISFFFLLKQITQSNAVAFFTCLIAAFGFHMPAHLVNWGKYPALLSLVGFQFVFCLGYILIKQELTHNQKTKLYWIIGLSILIATLIHTRNLIVFVLLVASLFISYQIKKISIRFQYFSFTFLFIIFGIEIYYISQNPALSPLITGYTQRDLWSLILVLFLMPFSIKFFPRLTFFLLTTICLFLSFLFIPISLPNYGTQTLLDRPFVQMFIYFPLSIMTGLGFASLLSIAQKIHYTKLLVTLVLFGFVLLNANFNYNFYPSDCCQLVSQDDLSAIAWIKNNTAPNSKILIAATQLYITSYEPAIPAPSDAGIWILPLTSRMIVPSFLDTNFDTPQGHKEICAQDINYIYLGSVPASFKQIQLTSQPNWYQPVFLLPQTKIYQVIGCQ